MRRPWHYLNVRTGRIWRGASWATDERALSSLWLFLVVPDADDYWLEGPSGRYHVPRLLQTIRTIERIYDVGRVVLAHATPPTR